MADRFAFRALTAGAIIVLAAVAPSVALAQAVDVPNASFERGQDTPADWTLSGGDGEWITEAPDGTRAVAVTGVGDSNYWQSGSLPLEPSTVYRVRFRARQSRGGGGCAVTGPVFCNRDLSGLRKDWSTYTSVFVTPSVVDPESAWLRFGQWHMNGTVAFDAVELALAQPVYVVQNGLILGEGEQVAGNQYTFRAPFNTASANHARPLVLHRCSFNTNRWVFGAGSEVVYRHHIARFKQTAAQVETGIGYYMGGELVIEASVDGQTWHTLGTLSGLESKAFDVPADMLPAEAVWVRVRAQSGDELGPNSDPGSFQVHGYEYRATLDGTPGDFRGKTRFVATSQADPRLKVAIETFGAGLPGHNVLVARVNNTSQETIATVLCLKLTPADGKPIRASSKVTLEPGEHEVRLHYSIPTTGTMDAVFTLGDRKGYRAETTFEISPYFDSSYGELLPASTDEVGLWWASSGWKVCRTRPLPKKKGKAVVIEAARNEAEAAQFIVRPTKNLHDFLAVPGGLEGPGGATIPTSNVEALRVRYVPVTIPSDKIGAVAPWPDPLPPFNGPIALVADENQPIWVRVKVPRDVPAGLYKGAIRLTAEGYEADVPLEVTVFDFTLPDRMTCQTAFGMSLGTVFRYQKLTTEGQQREVLEKYLASYSAHHISPYNPAPLDPLKVTWPGLGAWEGGARDPDVKHAGQSALRIADDNPTRGVSAVYKDLVAIPEQGLTIRFWYKTKAPAHPFIVTFLHHDANGQWMYGKNNDMRIEGNGQWQRFEKVVIRFPEGATHVQFKLWPALYVQDGATTGTVWYDEVSVADAATGDILIRGDFEPPDEAALTPHFDWAAWDAAMERAIDHYHFTSFRLGIPGLGGGTFHSRHEPSLLGYAEDTPEYKMAFTAYCQAVQEHLRDKGWLDEAYVYWFDEPGPKDYDFVMNGFRKLKEAAPDIRRMLTEQVEPNLVGGPNLWCPLTPSFDLETAEARRAEGDRFWWYICTGPKAPFVGLFIDHPGAELRVWGWQTWKRRVSGLLIWATTYWTSPCAYPDHDQPQNPYEDPMGWVSGYSTPAGAKRPWGNGDGRFVYPPEVAADAHPAGPVLEGPVDSIRFEMLRDGIEDYEYMAMLDRLIDQHRDRLSKRRLRRYRALLEVPEAISADLTHFTTNPAPIEKHRRAVARALERLSDL